MSHLTICDVAVDICNKSIIKPMNCTFKAGEFTAILGPNGAGKTTLLKSIMGLIPYSGTMGAFDINGKTLSRSAYSYLCQLNKTSSYLSVIEVVLLGLVHELNWKISSEQETKAEAVLQELNLIHLANQRFSDLSGGQQQLVSLAQALVGRPSVLLLDEPTSALDLKHQVQVLELARDYTKRHQCITISVLHDLSMAARYCDHLLLLDQGQIQGEGVPDKVLNKELLSRIYQVEVDVGICSRGHRYITPVRL